MCFKWKFYMNNSQHSVLYIIYIISHLIKSETMILSQIKGGFPLQVWEELLLQVVEFKYLRMFFMGEGRELRELDLGSVCSTADTESVCCLLVSLLFTIQFTFQPSPLVMNFREMT